MTNFYTAFSIQKPFKGLDFLKAFKKTLLFLAVFLMGWSVGWGQTSTQNFGSSTGSFATQTGANTFIPNPTSGTTWARAGNAPGTATVNTVTASNPLGTTDAYVRAVASVSTSVTKFSPWVAYTGGTEFYTSFKVLFGDASAGSTAASGNWSFNQGAGAMYNNNADFTSATCFTRLIFTYASSGAINLSYRAGTTANSTSGLSTTAFSQGTVYTVEIVGNNKTSGTISYTYSGNAQTVAVQKFDLYVNGTLIGNDLAEAQLPANTSIDAGTFIGASSTSNVANIFVDDAVTYNAVPAAIGAATPTISATGSLSALSTTYGTASSNTSFSVSGANMTAGILVTPPAGFEISQTAGSGFGATTTVGTAGTITSTTVYLRLAATTIPGSYSGNIVLSSSGASNVNVTTASSTVNTKALTVSGLTGANKFYDANTTASSTGTPSLVGIEGADVVTISGTPSLTFANATVGTAKAITVSGYILSGAQAGSYTLTQPTGLTGDITTKSLTITADDVTKTAGTPITGGAGSTAFSSAGLVGGQTIGSVTIAYGSAGASTGDGATPGVYSNQITASAATGGSFTASNYSTTYVQGSITVEAAPASPTISVSGTLDGLSTTYGTPSSTTNFTVSGAAMEAGITITPPVGFEVATTSDFSTTIGTASSPLVIGSAGTIANTTIYVRIRAVATVSGSPYSGNITLTSTNASDATVATVSSTVSTKALTITSLSASNRVYNATTNVTVTGTPTYVGLENGESFSVSGSPTWAFATKIVGTGKTINQTGSFTAPSTNYTVTQPTLTADITTKNLTTTGASAQNKVYDASTTATITGTSLVGVESGDAVSVSGGGTFASANVGTGISVTASLSLSGADAGNYTLTQPTGLTANITQASQTITFGTLANKITTDGPFALTATATSGLTVTYTSSNTAVATVSGSTVTIVGAAGTSTITASQAGNTNYSAAADVIQVLTVTAAPVAILQWNTFGNAGTETTEPSVFNDPNIASTNLTQGSITAAANANRFGGTNWWNTGNATNSTLANAVAGNDYIQFIVTPNSGYAFTPTSFVFNWDKSGTGPQNVALRSSVDNFASDLGTVVPTAVIGTSNTITISGLNNIETATTFRVYGYGGTATAGSGGFDVGSDVVNVQLNGYVKSVPQLSTPTTTSITTTSATIGATITSDGGATITARGTVWGTTASPTSNLLAEGGLSVAAFSHSRTGLTPNTFYYYRGYATNSIGTGYSADSTFTTFHNAPIVGSGSNATASSIDANWTAPSGGSASFTYEVQVDNDNDFSSPTFTQNNISSGSTTITATGLASNTTYYFRLRANNATGSSAWSSTSVGYNTLAVSNPTMSGTSLTAFGNVCINTTVSPNSFTINGAALSTADVTVSSLSGFTFSTSSGGTYTSSLTLSQPGGTYAQDIFVKFNPIAVQSYGGNIVIGGGGASDVNVAVVGSGILGTVTITTTAANSITAAGASTGGSSISTTCGTITAKGVAYGTSSNPTTPVTSDGTGTGNYTSIIAGLTPNTLYNYRAYAINSNSVTSYGSNLTFTTIHNAPTAGAGSGATTSAITANWNAPTGGGSETFTYEVAISTSSSFASTLSSQSGISSASASYQFTGLTNGTTFYFRVRVINAGGNSDWSAISSGIATLTVWENFETGTKGSYAAGDVTCSAGSWNMSFALIGTSANDRKSNIQSVRIQSTGILSMNFDVLNGISSLTIYHAKYGNDANSTWRLEVSNNSGATWSAYVSSDISTSSTTLTAQTFNVDLCGTVRFRIVKTSGGTSDRINIDDIVLVEKAAIPSAPTASAQSYCSAVSPTVANLVATGDGIQWYSASSGGSPLSTVTALTTGTYYASQTLSGCESALRTSVPVTLNSNGTWIGGTVGNWNDANNWCGGIPNSNSAVVSIPTGVTINLNVSPSVLNLTIGSGATINLGSNTLTLANNGSLINNGTFNSETGTVVFAGAGAISGNATSFYNVTTNGNLTLGSSHNINGLLTLTFGTVTVGANTLTINGSISRTAGNIEASNASATVIFSGSSAQSIPSSTFTGAINNLSLNNSAGLTTNQALTVANTLSLQNGILTLGSNNLTLSGLLHTTNNGGATSYINTAGSGAFIRSISATGVDYKFPVGLSAYAPISVNFTGGAVSSSTLASRAVSGLHPAAVDGPYIRTNVYWEMNQIGMSNPQYNVSFTYPGITSGSGSTEVEADLLPSKWSASDGWKSTGSCAVCTPESTMGSSSINTSTKTITWNGVTGFSDFVGLGQGNGSPLPIELISFSAECIDNQTVLNWQTASENNSSYFEIEKSMDGLNWILIGQVAAAGNSNELLSYSFPDAEKSNGYYRLNQFDMDGKNEYFGPISSSCISEAFDATTFPNPSDDNFYIKIKSVEEISAYYTIRDMNGRILHNQKIEILHGNNLFLSQVHLEAGVYFISIVDQNNNNIITRHIRY